MSGEFLEFDRETGRYVVGALQEALLALKQDVVRLQRESASLTFDERWWLVEHFRGLKDVEHQVDVENHRLVGVISLHDRQHNVVALTVSVLRALDGDPSHLGAVRLRHATPFDEMIAEMDNETPTATDAEAWVEKVATALKTQT